jgi:hypothetical protein
MSPRLTIVTSDPILTRGLRGRTWLVFSFLGLLAGLGVYLSTPPAYTATAVVELASVAPAVDLSPTAAKIQDFTVDSDAQLVSDGQVVSAVAHVTNQPSAQVSRSLNVTARQLTRVLQISYTAHTRVTATAGAQAAADAFLAERDRLVVKPVQDYLVDVFNNTETPQRSATLTTEGLTTSAQARVENWRQRAIGAQLQSKGAGSVLQRALIRAGGDRGSIVVPVGSGGGLGALLGVAVALAWAQVKQARMLSRARTHASTAAEVVIP